MNAAGFEKIRQKARNPMSNVEIKGPIIPMKSFFVSLWGSRKFVFVAALFAILCLTVFIGGQLSINIWYLLNIGCAVTIIAYRYPYFTVVLVFVLGQIMGQEAQLLLPENFRQPEFGPLRLRYFDPILLGIVLAVVLKLIHRDKILFQFLFQDYLFWTLLIGWLAIEIVRSLGTYNTINILGEFRTYYQYVLLLPYMVLFFQTERQHWRLFKLLMALSFLLIFSGIIRGWILHDFVIGIGHRWLSSYANLAFLHGVVALCVSIKHRLLKVNSTVLILLFISFFVMTIFNGHRSVWLATGVAFLALIFTGQISFKSYILTWIAGIIAVALVVYIFQMKGEDVFLFFDNRMMAFTNYKYDPTAYWRCSLWMEAYERIRENVFLGLGLGQHFQLRLSWNELVTTSPHNLYITITYHLGIMGLFLYLGFICQFVLFIHKALKLRLTVHQRAIILATFVIMASGSVYYIAYGFDYSTWMYIGLGIGTIMNVMNSKELT